MLYPGLSLADGHLTSWLVVVESVFLSQRNVDRAVLLVYVLLARLLFLIIILFIRVMSLIRHYLLRLLTVLL